jgi:hypothetical protein
LNGRHILPPRLENIHRLNVQHWIDPHRHIMRKDLGDQVDHNMIGEDCVPFADGYVFLVD